MVTEIRSEDFEEQYGEDILRKDTETPFDWGMLSGKISAIRWVLGRQKPSPKKR
ncbi:hypothetical protein IEQ44_07445 [Nocardioides sp. Y6]|uniref:Uncharacterized protein n=1 Tax=Nocardioides malaquae TaxID=2773426 RepID=A0ABR9RSD2_9ACTN|nr:hypothetical protein [Nocardioides malaquae]MBE7324484.1 hypothetical protein [Nocardioides malaquae]